MSIYDTSFATEGTFESSLAAELPRLRRMAGWLARDRDDADDLVQDTAVLAIRFKESYSEGTNLGAWLSRVMRNRFISVQRRRRLERTVLESEGRHSVASWSIGSSARRATERDGDVARDQGLSDPVVFAMDGLRAEFREVVWLCDVEGLSYADAASRLSCPIGTIMSRLHRGRRALRRSLGSRELIEAA